MTIKFPALHRPCSSSAAILVAFAIAGVCASIAEASTMYGSSGAIGSPPIYTIDQTTGTPTFLGTTGIRSIANMASDWRQSSFRLWAVDDLQNRLLQINPTTGAATVVGAFSSGLISSIAFDVLSGQMYAADHSSLYRVDTTTATTTLVGSLGTTGMYGLCCDLNGTLYGSTYPDGGLWRISTSTGTASRIGGGANSMIDIACRPEDGVMFGVSTLNSFSIYQIDTGTGAQTLVGPYGLSSGINGLAFSAVPAPGALALLGLACLGRRRR
jgi:hypothetical protein